VQGGKHGGKKNPRFFYDVLGGLLTVGGNKRRDHVEISETSNGVFYVVEKKIYQVGKGNWGKKCTRKGPNKRKQVTAP